MEELHTWLQWIEKWTQKDTSREVTIAREESREKCNVTDTEPCIQPLSSFSTVHRYLQHYVEPSSEPMPAGTSTAVANATVLPLGSGTLTHNMAGIPIVVVCTKADLIDEGADAVGAAASGMGGMVKGKGGEWEERTDGVMQILRTICLKCKTVLI